MFNDIQKFLNLKDPNVTFSDDCIETHNNQLYITATLSYPVDCCPQCKAQHSVVKNGRRRSKITWIDLAGQACYLLLNK